MIRRVAVVQDLSCVGRCSLTTALAVLPVMGLETAALPTALLSGHTAFSSVSFLDLTDEAERIIEQWKKQELTFDTIYIGYLGSERLVGMAEKLIALFRGAKTRVILDPAFGDHGKLYKGFDENYVRAVAGLCRRADIILPNLTELCFLSGLPYSEDADAETAAKVLLGETLKNVLITSAPFADGRMGVCCAGEEVFTYAHERLPLSCCGTGDLFASVFTGAVTLGRDVHAAAVLAADFVRDCLRYSMNCPDHRWYGVDYEPMLKTLAERI